MNVLVLGGRIIGPALAQELVRGLRGRALHRARSGTRGAWRR